jgi:voltage-gated potassium channel
MTTIGLASASPSSVAAAQSAFAARYGRPEEPWRLRLYTMIFESDTPAGRRFDLFLIFAILASVLVVILDSVESLTADHNELFAVLEWSFTILFTVE